MVVEEIKPHMNIPMVEEFKYVFHHHHFAKICKTVLKIRILYYTRTKYKVKLN